jgi:hypothetical protein
MTNLDFWKQGINAEDFAKIISKQCKPCSFCPGDYAESVPNCLACEYETLLEWAKKERS